MATVSKFPNANAVVTTGLTNPTNAYADDGVYATASPGKNAFVVTDFGFPAFTTSEIPDGSTINSITVECKFKVSTISSIANQTITPVNGSTLLGAGTQDSTEPLTDKVITDTVVTGVTLDDLRIANQVKARSTSNRGNSNTQVTFSIDYVKLTVDYTEAAPANTPISDSDSSTATESATVDQHVNFPVTPVIDTLQSAGGLSANWTTGGVLGDAGLISEDADGAFEIVQPSSAVWNPTSFDADQESYLTVPILPSSGTITVQVWVRITNSPSATATGYFLRVSTTTGIFDIRKKIAGGASSSIGTFSQAFVAGDSFGLSVAGSTLTAWYKSGAGAWTQVGSVVDASISGVGNIGFSIGGSTVVRVSGFGGGNPKVLISGSDSGTSSESGLVSSVTAVTGTDSNGTETEIIVLHSIESFSDNASSVETQSGIFAQASSDSVGLSETSSERAIESSSDTGISNETISERSVESSSDSATSIEGSSEVFLVTPAAESNSEVETTNKGITSSDISFVVGDSATLNVVWTLLDSGSDSESTTLKSILTGSDLGLGTDTGTQGGITPIFGTDSGAGSNTQILNVSENSVTTGVGSEIAGFAVTLNALDQGAGSFESAKTAQGSLDIGLWAESGLQTAQWLLADTGSSTEQASQTSGGTTISGSDSGSSQEAVQATAGIGGTDSSHGTEAAILGAYITSPDGTGSTIENALYAARAVASDLGVGFDPEQIQITILSPDTGATILEAARLGLIGADSGIGNIEAELIFVDVIDSDNGNSLEAQVLLFSGIIIQPNAPWELLGVKVDFARIIGARNEIAVITAARKRFAQITGVKIG